MIVSADGSSTEEATEIGEVVFGGIKPGELDGFREVLSSVEIGSSLGDFVAELGEGGLVLWGDIGKAKCTIASLLGDMGELVHHTKDVHGNDVTGFV